MKKSLPARLFLGFAAGLIVACAARPGLAQDACTPQLAASLPIQFLDDGRAAVPVRLQGRDFSMLLDTGGLFSTVTPALADMLGVTQRRALEPLYAVGGTALDRDVTIEQVQIAALPPDRHVFYVESDGRAPPPLAGTMALDMLCGRDLDLDFGAGKFNLVTPQDCPAGPVYWTRQPFASVPLVSETADEAFGAGWLGLRHGPAMNGRNRHIRIPVSLDGKPLVATLDTGAAFSIISRGAARRFLGIEADNPDLQPIPSELASQVYSYPFKALAFGGVTVNTPRIFILPDEAMRNQGSDLILGIGVLRPFHLYVAMQARRLYLTAADTR